MNHKTYHLSCLRWNQLQRRDGRLSLSKKHSRCSAGQGTNGITFLGFASSGSGGATEASE